MSYWYVHWKENDQDAVATQVDAYDFAANTGTLTDYLANDLGVRLCSQTMKDVIESLAPGACQWADATVTTEHRVARYFVLESCETMARYLSTHTVRTGLFIIKPVLDREAIRAVPTVPVLQAEEGGIRWAVHARVKAARSWQALSGVDWSRVPEN